MGGKSGGQTEITQYFMSLHIGVCAYSEGLQFLALKFGDKTAARVILPNDDGGRGIMINRLDLFGGDKKEGGVEGKMYWLDGNPDQVMPENLAAKFGRTSATCPGFRGLASIFLTEPDPVDASNPEQPATALGRLYGWFAAKLSGRPRAGFYLTANNPYLKAISVRVRRPSIGLNPDLALIQIEDDSEGNQQFSSNAAHIIYECLTSKDFGLAEDPAAFDIDQWEAAAETLYDEKFGLSLIWTRQSSIEKFVKEIIDHIQAKININPETGLYELKLLRGDYDPEDLPVLSPDNAEFSNYVLKSWSSVTNEVVVNWTNPETGKSEAVTAQEPAAIALQGGITSDTRNYYAIPDRTLAMSVAERDVAIAAYPLATLDAEVTLEFWLTMVGDVVKVNWPKRGVAGTCFRVSKVERGSQKRTVRLSLYEDVFGLPKPAYLGSTGTGWGASSQLPTPISTYKVGTAPAFMTVHALELSNIGQLEYPECVSLIALAGNTVDDSGVELYGMSTTVTGQPVPVSLGETPLRTSWAHSGSLAAEVVSSIPIPSYVFGLDPIVGDFLMIGSGPDSTNEFCVITAISNSIMQVSRGVLDTVPREWPIGTRIWALPAKGGEIGDETRRSAFETVPYRFLSITSKGTLDYDSAPEVSVTLSERPHLPLRPANVKVNGIGFGPVTVSASATLTVTWANRNRLVEATQILKWTDANTAPEAGQTTKISVLDGTTRALISSISVPIGSLTSQVVTPSNMGAASSVIIRVTSIRDGMESLQGHEILVNRT